jgi:hypothetical protein
MAAQFQFQSSRPESCSKLQGRHLQRPGAPAARLIDLAGSPEDARVLQYLDLASTVRYLGSIHVHALPHVSRAKAQAVIHGLNPKRSLAACWSSSFLRTLKYERRASPAWNRPWSPPRDHRFIPCCSWCLVSPTHLDTLKPHPRRFAHIPRQSIACRNGDWGEPAQLRCLTALNLHPKKKIWAANRFA